MTSLLASSEATDTHHQLERSRKNIARLESMGLRTFEQLPSIDEMQVAATRSTDETVSRCVAVMICAVKGETSNALLTRNMRTWYSALATFTPREHAFLADPSPPPSVCTGFAWRYESLHVFLWALGYLPSLAAPNQRADIVGHLKLVRDMGPQQFALVAMLRPLSEILDHADLYKRLCLAAYDLMAYGQTNDALDAQIVHERHRALKWLIRYSNRSWDDLSPDT